MVDKVHYQAAAAEVEAGHIDQALWIKVAVDMPVADNVTRQAKYIQLRAREMALAAKESVATRFIPQRWWQWILFVGSDFLIASFIAASGNGDSTTTFAFIVFVLFLGAAIVWRLKHPSIDHGPTVVNKPVESGAPAPTSTPITLLDREKSEPVPPPPLPSQAEAEHPLQSDHPASGNYASLLWFLCGFCAFVASYILVTIDFSNENIHSEDIGYFCGRLLAYFLMICAVPFLVGIVTLFRKPGVYFGLVILSFLILIVFLAAGHVITPDTSGNQSTQPVAQDKAETVRPYHLPASHGDERAQYRLAAMYYEGQGVPQNDVEALKQLRLAATQGYAPAEAEIGLIYRDGDGVRQDNVEAAKWFHLAAAQGYAMSQYGLARAYHYGQGVPQDNAKALKWLRLASAQGDVNAQAELGYMYYQGRGVPENYAEALQWTSKAAEQGDRTSQLNLGEMYSQGEGVAQDNVEAMKWSLLAKTVTSNGTSLLKASDQQIALLAVKMTQSQIAEARQKAKAWWIAHHSGAQ